MAFDAQSYHKPILAEKCIEFLNVRQGGIYVDCTAGGGGHSALILEKLSGKGTLLAFDKDDDAIRFCAKRFEGCAA
ncbi:MAG: 16S rRNA (cytosine(1402)-N(4))-methyltransferase [Christensenellales bacterium]